MADGYAHYQQSGNPFPTFPQQLRRRATPPQTPSPSRSPAPQSPGAAYFYNSNQQSHPHTMMNAHSQRSFMAQPNMAKFGFMQGQQVEGLSHLQNLPTPTPAGQHTFSSALAGSNFSSPQHATVTTASNGNSEYWKEQQTMLATSRQAGDPHHHARQAAILHKNSSASVPVSGGVNPISYQPTNGQHRKDGPPAEVVERRNKNGEVKRQDWNALDLGGQGLHAVSMALFQYTFLDKLYLNHNQLTKLPPAIGKLKLLQHLDVSSNKLTELPPEIGLLTNLKQLLLFDNDLAGLPVELGTLHQLDFLGIEGNPIPDEYKQLVMKNGTRALIMSLRDTSPEYLNHLPATRDWIVIDNSSEPNTEKFQVLCYNVLCEKYATAQMYGYVASWALNWDYRKKLIKQQLEESKSDIMCLQEIDQDAFSECFMPALAMVGYKGVFQAKGRAKTMTETERKSVDGCATFYDQEKFILVDKAVVEFNTSAIAREDFKATSDVFNRVMPRDDIAIITFLESKLTGNRTIVVNVHIFWDPHYKDVKLIQVAMLLDEIAKLSSKWTKAPRPRGQGSSTPSPPEFSENTQIPLIICGDFNSIADSSVYELLSRGMVSSDHADLHGRTYGNATRDGIQHPFSLKSSYSNIGELSFTNYTPGFTGVIDYIWYSNNTLSVTGLLGDINTQYLATVPGFPNKDFPSDHIPLIAEFEFKPRKDLSNKPPPPDFGGGSGGTRAR